MQTGAKDPVDPAMFEPRISLAGEVPAFQLLLAGKLVERADEVVIAMVQRARHVLAQDEQLGDAPGVDGIAIDVAVGAKGADRAQQRAPLVIVDQTADLFAARQQHVIFHVEDARGVVGALDEGAEADEAEGVVMQHGAEHDAAEEMRALLHPIEEIAVTPALQPLEIEILHLEPGRVQAFPGLA